MDSKLPPRKEKVKRRSHDGRSIRRVKVGGEAVRHPLGGSLRRIPGKVSVAGGGLDLAATEQLADHRQAFAEG